MNTIFDCHTHIDLDLETREDYENNMSLTGIEKTIIMCNPFIKEIRCQKNASHYVAFNDEQNCLVARCEQCNSIVYTGDDPYRSYNENLMDSFQNTNFYPFLMLAMSSSTIYNNIAYYTQNYNGKFYGFKLYTGLSANALDYIAKLETDYPLLIHTGIQDNQNPIGMLKFVENYKGKIIFAHFCRLHYDFLKIINNYDNIFVDTSPAFYLFNRYIVNGHNGGLFKKENIRQPSDLYHELLQNIGIDKVVFGSDYPFSEIKNETSVLQSLGINEDDYMKLTRKNFQRFLEKS